jgi:hypothetical protein
MRQPGDGEIQITVLVDVREFGEKPQPIADRIPVIRLPMSVYSFAGIPGGTLSNSL